VTIIYDVIVIGGGPSGLMAAIAAAEHGANVRMIDKGDKLGRKLGISGGGRPLPISTIKISSPSSKTSAFH